MMTQPGFEQQEAFKNLMEGYLTRLSQDNSLQKVRAKAWDHFLELGLPSRHNEVYRYIKLRHLLLQTYPLAQATSLDKEQIAPFIYPECQQSFLVFVNGYFSHELSNIKGLTSKVTISTLQDAMRTYGSFLNNFWAKAIKEETDPFATLNTALHPQGAFIYVPPKTVIDTPIQILNFIQTHEQPFMLVPRLHVFVGANSQVQIIASQQPLGSQAYFANQVTEFTLEEDSHVHYTQILCDENPEAWHLDALRARLKRNATFKTIALTEGSLTLRNDYRISLMGENAEVLLNGVWMLKDKKEAHTNVFIDHQAPACRSSQLFKGVLNDFSRSSFEGKIMVRQQAQKTEAFQLNNNLLLSDRAHADSKPNLEIFADDVKASHGATVGQLDIEQLFYMKTRGFSDEEAKNLLVYGFCEQVIEMIGLPSVRQAISARAQRYLGRG